MALVNNMFEIRLDAVKFITLKRRVPVKMAKNIGAWASIFKSIAKVFLKLLIRLKYYQIFDVSKFNKYGFNNR